MKFTTCIIGDITLESAKEACETILASNSKNISVFLCSSGGSVNGAMAIISAFFVQQRRGNEIHVHVAGVAESAAIMVTQAANRRTMEPFSQWLIHPHFMAGDKDDTDSMDISDLNALVDQLAYSEFAYFEIINRRSGFSLDQLLEQAHYRNRERMLLAPECLKWNLIDEILDYPLPSVKQETTIPTDNSLDNVVSIPSRGTRKQPSVRKRTSRTANRRHTIR